MMNNNNINKINTSLEHVFLYYEFVVKDNGTVKGLLISPFTFIIPLTFKEKLDPVEISASTILDFVDELTTRMELISMNLEPHYKYNYDNHHKYTKLNEE